MRQWLKFFMVGVIQMSESSVSTFREITHLRSEVESKIMQMGRRRKSGRQLLNYLFTQPLISAKDVEETLQCSTPTANALIKDFKRLDILKEKTKSQRNRIYSFTQYIGLFEKNG